jgi:hypothetical protein
LGDGKIVISAGVGGKAVAEANVAVVTRKSSHVEILADSDGVFEYHLSLPFVVTPGLEKYYTTTENSSNEDNLVVISLVVVLSLIVTATALTCVLRCCIHK